MANTTYGAVKRSTLTSIADAIRSKMESSDLITPDEMADAIASISSGLEFIAKNYFRVPGSASVLLFSDVQIVENCKIEISYDAYTAPSSQQSVINTDRQGWDSRLALNIHYDGNNWYVCNQRVGNYVAGTHTFEFDLSNGSITLDGNTIAATISPVYSINNYLRIGDLLGLSGSSNYSAYIRSIKIWNSDSELIHNLYPISINDNACYMYDEVTGNIYGGKNWSEAVDSIPNKARYLT